MLASWLRRRDPVLALYADPQTDIVPHERALNADNDGAPVVVAGDALAPSERHFESTSDQWDAAVQEALMASSSHPDNASTDLLGEKRLEQTHDQDWWTWMLQYWRGPDKKRSINSEHDIHEMKSEHENENMKSKHRSNSRLRRKRRPTTSAPSVKNHTPIRPSLPPLHSLRTRPPNKKILILDLDETLVHSTSKPHLDIPTSISPTMKVDIKSGAFQILLHVFKRPHCDTFLRTVDPWFHVCIFTASLSTYANPVIDHLSRHAGIHIGMDKRFFREHCKAEWSRDSRPIYRKNLLALLPSSLAQDPQGQERCLRNMILVDNSLMSFGLQPRNGVWIESWICDPLDTGLLDLLPMLDALRFVDDVRHILGFREEEEGVLM